MYKAAFLIIDFLQPEPTAKEIKSYLHNSSKLLYGNDQRKSKNTPYVDKLEIIENCFSKFKHIFSSQQHTHQMLYIFDSEINETHFFLKYAPQVLAHFELDEKIIDEIIKITKDYGQLNSYIYRLQKELQSLDGFVEKNIGSYSFHKSFPAYVNASEKFIMQIDKDVKRLEKKASQIFQSGWS